MESGFFEIDEAQLLKNNSVYEMFFVKDLKQRKLYVTDEINQITVEDAVKFILQYNSEDKGIPVEERAPIKVYISSPGGDVDAGFELIDAIENSITPVYTINLGYEYSMAFLIGLSGHKRFAMPNSKFLMHDGSSFVYNSGAKAQDQMKFNARIGERIKDFVISRSKLAEKEYDEKSRVEWYLFADDAKEKGFVDEIVGVDCDIEQII